MPVLVHWNTSGENLPMRIPFPNVEPQVRQVDTGVRNFTPAESRRPGNNEPSLHSETACVTTSLTRTLSAKSRRGKRSCSPTNTRASVQQRRAFPLSWRVYLQAAHRLYGSSVTAGWSNELRNDGYAAASGKRVSYSDRGDVPRSATDSLFREYEHWRDAGDLSALARP